VTCPTGYYNEATGWVCLPCEGSCASCNGATKNDCLSCASNLFLNILVGNAGECIETCAAPLYGEASLRKCLACHPSCATCSQKASNCTSCTTYPDPGTNVFLSNGACVIA
jgi:proprotein convertase subtilisin/kexin type 5